MVHLLTAARLYLPGLVNDDRHCSNEFDGGWFTSFYLEISEAVRPKGTTVAALGWLWTVEGTFASLGAALGGFISEQYSPRYCLALTTVCVGIGYLIMRGGSGLLKAADRIPSEDEDTDALGANLNINK